MAGIKFLIKNLIQIKFVKDRNPLWLRFDKGV